MRRIVLLGLILSLHVPSADAQVLETAIHRLRIDTTNRTVTDGTTVLSLDKDDTQVIRIKNEKAVQFVIIDYNPLIFTYTVNAGPPTDTPNYTAAKDMFSQLSTLVSLLGGAKRTTAESKMTIEGLDVDAFAKKVASVDEDFQQITVVLKTSMSDLTSAVATIQGWNVADLKKAIDAGFKAATAIDQKCGLNQKLHVEQSGADGQDLACGDSTITSARSSLQSLRNNENDTSKQVATLVQLSQAAQKAGIETAVGKRVAYSAHQDQPITLTIAVNTTLADAVPDILQAANARTGDMKFSVKPYSPVNLNFGGSVFYSFVRAPEYTVQGPAGSQKIQVKTNDYNALSVAGVLTITPRSWSEPTFGGHIQIGVSPVKDKIAILLGAGFDVEQMFSFGAGIIAQQVQTLGSGLSVGQVVDSPDALKTNQRFALGPYLHVTVHTK